jgi:hypothetical protein
MPSEALRDLRSHYNVESSPIDLRDEAGFLSIVSPERFEPISRNTRSESSCMKSWCASSVRRVRERRRWQGSSKQEWCRLFSPTQTRITGASSALSPRAEWSNEECRPLWEFASDGRGIPGLLEFPYARFFTVDSPPPALWKFEGAVSYTNSNATGLEITNDTSPGVSNCAFVRAPHCAMCHASWLPPHRSGMGRVPNWYLPIATVHSSLGNNK